MNKNILLFILILFFIQFFNNFFRLVVGESGKGSGQVRKSEYGTTQDDKVHGNSGSIHLELESKGVVRLLLRQ